MTATPMPIRASVIGATGYAGAELVRLLLNHPRTEIAGVSSVSYEGKKLSEVYPNLSGLCDISLSPADSIIPGSDVVFASLPHGLSEEIAAKCVAAGCVFIDLGADFRLDDMQAYHEWYGKEYTMPALHQQSVYCIPELHRNRLTDAPIIGNPGCYPTSVALGLAPALRSGLVMPTGVIIDSKSGVTGAGRGLTQNTHFPDTNEAFSAYKAACHRHTPEIEQVLSEIAGVPMTITFVPHLLPVNRGIESTIYVRMRENTETAYEAVRAAYERAYGKEKFVRLLPDGAYANIKNVRYSNYCDISLHPDRRNGLLIICACIDNMFKGAAGQAIQNMNIRFGLPEDTGLCYIPSSI